MINIEDMKANLGSVQDTALNLDKIKELKLEEQNWLPVGYYPRSVVSGTKMDERDWAIRLPFVVQLRDRCRKIIEKDGYQGTYTSGIKYWDTPCAVELLSDQGNTIFVGVASNLYSIVVGNCLQHDHSGAHNIFTNETIEYFPIPKIGPTGLNVGELMKVNTTT